MAKCRYMRYHAVNENDVPALGMFQNKAFPLYRSPEDPHPRRCGDSPSPVATGEGGRGVRASGSQCKVPLKHALRADVKGDRVWQHR